MALSPNLDPSGWRPPQLRGTREFRLGLSSDPNSVAARAEPQSLPKGPAGPPPQPVARPDKAPSMSFSIRSRVLLLVLAVLLPGMLGVAWLISSTYDAERQANERTLRETARAFSQVIDGELMRRATIARVLAQSPLLDGPAPASGLQLSNFEQQARRALIGLEGWIELRSAGQVLLDTRGPAFSGRSLPPRTLTQTQTQTPRIEPLWMPPSDNPGPEAGPATVAHAALVQPVLRDGLTLYELVITVLPVEMQRIVDAQALPPGWIGAVLDSQGNLVARYPGGAAFVGRQAAAELRRHLQDQTDALFQTVTLDGLPSTGWISRTSMGWAYATGMPNELFAGQLPGAVLRVGLSALLLLALAVAGALWLARRIVLPVQGLKAAVRQLRDGHPVQVPATGLAECDEVTAALAEAAQTIRHARADLERQVADAVEQTRLAEQRAAQGHRVAAVGRLTGGLAHDFNNLLGVISNSAHLMQRHPAAADLQAPLAATQRAVQMGSQLTQHLLRFAGRRPLRPQQVRLEMALPEMQELLRSVLWRSVKVVVNVVPGTAAVHLDASELELALISLALNARDAMPDGGEFRLRARNADVEDLADSPGLAPGRYVLISVGDDGVGIAPEFAAHAFEPFFTTKGQGQGSGLGLSQVHGFCTQAGGTARLQTTPGLGTTVLLLLPAADEASTLPSTEAAPGAGAEAAPGAGAEGPLGADAEWPPGDEAQAPPGPVASPQAERHITGARVLLVEDNQALGDITAALLVAHGARVQRADDATQALGLIEAGASFDVVLSDVMMPGTMDGLALARRLRALRPRLPVVLITAFSQAVADAGAEFKVLNKPCPQDELLLALNAAIGTPAGGSA